MGRTDQSGFIREDRSPVVQVKTGAHLLFFISFKTMLRLRKKKEVYGIQKQTSKKPFI